jgi:hypothetical protein
MERGVVEMRKTALILSGIIMLAPISCSLDTVTTGTMSVEGEKAAILERFAPRLWFAVDEVYFASSVEWSFPNLKRVLVGGRYWLVTKSPLLGEYLLAGPEYKDVYVHPYFHGSLESAEIYAFWVEKTIGPAGGSVACVDLVYYIYYPYNAGKMCGGVRYENHVGDWEYIVVRVTGDDPYSPLEVAYSAHDFVGVYDWADVEKAEDTHPVAHVAWGSHGNWKDAGSHHYDTIVCELHDYCSRGTAWDTWHCVRAFDFSERKALNGGDWPVWMGEDFSEPGGSNPYDPAAGAVYRWGNPEGYCWEWACVLTTGPTGPISKVVFYSEGYE